MWGFVGADLRVCPIRYGIEPLVGKKIFGQSLQPVHDVLCYNMFKFWKKNGINLYGQ